MLKTLQKILWKKFLKIYLLIMILITRLIPLNWENELEELSNRLQEPVNLNSATREQLEQFPFLSDIQIEHLLAYIYIHGQMETIYELQLVEELDRQTIQYLLPFVCIKAINNEPAFRWKTMLKDAGRYGKNEVLTRLDIPFYKRKGYEHTYLGPSVYNSVKYTFRYRDQLYAGELPKKMPENLLLLCIIATDMIITHFIYYFRIVVG